MLISVPSFPFPQFPLSFQTIQFNCILKLRKRNLETKEKRATLLKLPNFIYFIGIKTNYSSPPYFCICCVNALATPSLISLSVYGFPVSGLFLPCNCFLA